MKFYSAKNWLDVSALFLEQEIPAWSKGKTNWEVSTIPHSVGSEIYTETLTLEDLREIIGDAIPFDEWVPSLKDSLFVF